MSKIEKLVLDKYKEPIQNSDELVNAEKYFNGNYTKIENKVNEVIDNIDTRLNTLETDNTNNKQNILSIQQEQINQNNNIAQNKTDIELLEENLSDEITTEEAENLTVKDATRWYSKLDVSGNSIQASRSGKNKFDVSKVSTAIADKSIDKETGTIQLNVNTDAGANATAIYLCELKPNTSYKIVYIYEGNKAGFGGTINNYLYNETSKTYEYLNNQKKITTNSSGKVQINLIGCQGAIPTVNYCKWSNIMLLEETEDETFEEYGTMPSSNYLAEIRNCGDNINLFKPISGKLNGTYGIDCIVNEDESIELNGTATAGGWIELNPLLRYGTSTPENSILNYKDETYTISFWKISGDVILSDEKDLMCCIENKNSDISQQINTYIDKSNTFECKNTKLYRAWFTFAKGAIFKNLKLSIKLEKGKKTSFSKYDCGSIDLDINNGNILGKGFSTEKENSKFWNTITDNVVTPLSDGWARFEIDNTTGTSARYANAWINLEQFRKNIKANTQYKIIVEFRNIKMDNNDNSSYFCVVGNNVNEIFRGDNKYFRGGILQLKQNIILTSRTQEEINSRKLLLRSFLCAVPGKQVSVECRVSLSKDLNIENYITGESQIITFPLEKNQKLYKGDYLAVDGIHHVKKQIRICTTNFNTYMPFDGLCFIQKKANIDFNYKNIEGLCTHFKNAHDETITGNTNARDKLQDYQFNFRNGTVKDRVYFKNKAFTTAQDWSNFFENNEVILEYESTEETIEEYTEEQQAVYNKLQKLLLYKHYNYIECIDEVNCKMKLTYRPDKFLLLQNQIDEIKTQMATNVAE